MTAAVEPVAGGAPETETSEVVASTPVLITVQEVAFSTATVLSPEPTTARRWYAAPSVVAMAVRRMMVSATPDNPLPGGSTRSAIPSWNPPPCRAKWIGCRSFGAVPRTGEGAALGARREIVHELSRLVRNARL